MSSLSTRHPEVRQYAQLLDDKRVYELPTLEDARGYTRMRLRQRRQSVTPLPTLRPEVPPTVPPEADVIAEAYLLSLRIRKKVAPQPAARLDAKTKALISELYHAGVLPLRLGGVPPIVKKKIAMR